MNGEYKIIYNILKLKETKYWQRFICKNTAWDDQPKENEEEKNTRKMYAVQRRLLTENSGCDLTTTIFKSPKNAKHGDM